MTDPVRTGDRQLLLIVSGGIAVYKAGDVVRELRRRGVAVQVIMTAAATEFVRPLTFEALSGRAVYTELLPGCTDGAIDHIELGKQADLVLVAPATASFLAAWNAGLAHDLALATLLALPANVPMVVAPAMNTRMWENPLTRRNLASLEALFAGRLTILPPVEKELACGEVGAGGLPEPATLVDAVVRALGKARIAGPDS